jgi:hypothetical protein
MFYACVRRFDVTENLKNLANFLASKRYPDGDGGSAHSVMPFCCWSQVPSVMHVSRTRAERPTCQPALSWTLPPGRSGAHYRRRRRRRLGERLWLRLGPPAADGQWMCMCRCAHRAKILPLFVLFSWTYQGQCFNFSHNKTVLVDWSATETISRT